MNLFCETSFLERDSVRIWKQFFIRRSTPFPRSDPMSGQTSSLEEFFPFSYQNLLTYVFIHFLHIRQRNVPISALLLHAIPGDESLGLSPGPKCPSYMALDKLSKIMHQFLQLKIERIIVSPCQDSYKNSLR